MEKDMITAAASSLIGKIRAEEDIDPKFKERLDELKSHVAKASNTGELNSALANMSSLFNFPDANEVERQYQEILLPKVY